MVAGNNHGYSRLPEMDAPAGKLTVLPLQTNGSQVMQSGPRTNIQSRVAVNENTMPLPDFQMQQNFEPTVSTSISI